MTLAKETFDQRSQNPATHRFARERADAIELHQFELATRQSLAPHPLA